MPVDLGKMENFDQSDDDSLFGAVWDIDFMEVVAKEDADLSFLDNIVLPAHPTEPDLPPSSENCRTQGPTFLSISEEQKAEFVNSMKNKNTAKKLQQPLDNSGNGWKRHPDTRDARLRP